MDFDLEEWKGVGDGDLSKELFGSDKGFKTTKSKKRKIVDKENAFSQPNTKKQKSSNVSTPTKQVIKQGSKNKRNKYKNFSKKEVEFTDKQSDKGSSNEGGKEKIVNKKDSDKLNKKNVKRKQAEDADKGNSANLQKKNKRKREESVPTEIHEGAGVKKRKRKRSEKLAVNGLGESSKETKDSISNGETKKKKNKKKDSSAKKSEKVVKGDGQSTGSETGTEGVTGEVKKKKRRKKKKKPSSKKNKYKHLDEARKAAREAAQEGTINALENNSSSISKADEKRSVDNSEIKVTSHKISGKKGRKVKLNKSKNKETKIEKHSKISDSVPVESSISSTEENVKSVEKGLVGKKMKKRKMECKESKNSSNDRTEKSSCVSTNTGPILASVDGVGATGKKKNNKKRKGKEVGESGVTHLSDTCNLSAVTKSNNDQGKKSPKTTFNVKKLGEILQNSESKAQEGKGEKQHGKKKKQKLENENSTEDSNKSEKLSINEKPNRKENKEMTLKERMTNQLKAARFRYLNEKLYTQSGDLAMEMFKKDRESYMVYHEGFQTQVAKWPTNPVDVIIEELKKCNPRTVIADFGCGDAKIARSLPLKIHSFDLVAINKYVTACNMAKVPLSNSTVDVAVFCLSLMGTNLKDYLTEANRVLKKNGTMKVAEVSSRFNSVPRFLLTVEKFGFKLTSQDDSNKMFIMLNFKKTGLPKTGAPDFKLHPCVYKKR